MADNTSDSAFGCGICFLVLSFIFYVLAIGVGWSLNQDVYPDNGLIRAGIIITTVPVFSAIFYFCSCIYCGSESGFTYCASGCAIVSISLAGVLELVGGIMLIVAGTQVKEDSTKALIFGVTSGVFSILAAITCCCSLTGICERMAGGTTSSRTISGDED